MTFNDPAIPYVGIVLVLVLLLAGWLLPVIQ